MTVQYCTLHCSWHAHYIYTVHTSITQYKLHTILTHALTMVFGCSSIQSLKIRFYSVESCQGIPGWKWFFPLRCYILTLMHINTEVLSDNSQPWADMFFGFYIHILFPSVSRLHFNLIVVWFVSGKTCEMLEDLGSISQKMSELIVNKQFVLRGALL